MFVQRLGLASTCTFRDWGVETSKQDQGLCRSCAQGCREPSWDVLFEIVSYRNAQGCLRRTGKSGLHHLPALIEGLIVDLACFCMWIRRLLRNELVEDALPFDPAGSRLLRTSGFGYLDGIANRVLAWHGFSADASFHGTLVTVAAVRGDDAVMGVVVGVVAVVVVIVFAFKCLEPVAVHNARPALWTNSAKV